MICDGVKNHESFLCGDFTIYNITKTDSKKKANWWVKVGKWLPVYQFFPLTVNMQAVIINFIL